MKVWCNIKDGVRILGFFFFQPRTCFDIGCSAVCFDIAPSVMFSRGMNRSVYKITDWSVECASAWFSHICLNHVGGETGIKLKCASVEHHFLMHCCTVHSKLIHIFYTALNSVLRDFWKQPVTALIIMFIFKHV